MSAVFLKILHMGMTASYLILAVFVVRVILKRAPKWIVCLLWGLVGIRLLCPVSIKSSFSLLPRENTVAANIAAARQTVAPTGGAIAAPAAVWGLPDVLVPKAAGDVTATHTLVSAAAAIWFTGVIVMLLYALFSFFKLRKTVAGAVPTENGVMMCDSIVSPFILGFIKPVIYAPADLPKETLRSVLEHESAHLKRRDHIWKPLGFWLLAVYWFHPLCWVSYILLCRDIETACDERVIRNKSRADVAAYSQALLDCSFRRTRIAACPLAFGEVGVKQRIRNVLSYKKPKAFVIGVAAALCAAVFLGFMTDPAVSSGIASPVDGVGEAAIARSRTEKPEERITKGTSPLQADAPEPVTERSASAGSTQQETAALPNRSVGVTVPSNRKEQTAVPAAAVTQQTAAPGQTAGDNKTSDGTTTADPSAAPQLPAQTQTPTQTHEEQPAQNRWSGYIAVPKRAAQSAEEHDMQTGEQSGYPQPDWSSIELPSIDFNE